jgi:hypothetical protein
MIVSAALGPDILMTATPHLPRPEKLIFEYIYIHTHTSTYETVNVTSLTSAIDGDGWIMPRPRRFISRKETWYLVYRRLGGPHSQSA